MCSAGMSNSTNPRLQRIAKAPRKFGRRNYRQAFPFLTEEFKSRCVYSDVHIACSGGDVAMHIDHYNPKKKKLVRQDYFNLLLAAANCNSKKGEYWPNARQLGLGLRIINPCSEPDYSVHVVECPKTHRLWGKTVTGRFHITRLGLNAWHLVDQRAMRHMIYVTLNDLSVGRVKDDDKVLQTIGLLKRQLETLPGAIPFEEPPANYIFV